MAFEHIEIIPASRDDIRDIQHLFRKMFEIYHVDQDIDYPYSAGGTSYLKNCIDHQIALVAKDGETTVGFLTGAIEEAMPFKTYQQQGHLHNLFVLEAYRGQGIGKRLTRRFIQKCSENNVHRILTDSDNTEALRHFYTSLGFHISGVNYEMNTRGIDHPEE